jgi:SAM-dependent methyltransferase
MAREQRFVFGEVADLYDRARPGYPAALVDDVLESCGLPAPRVLEVGAGTGKATVAFAARGLEIVALEPTAEMASVAARNVAAFPAVTVEVATFEEWHGSGALFDLVLAAQSWHLLRPGVRCRKAHDELKPGGSLALVWNLPVWEDGDLRAELDAVYDRHASALRRSQGFPALEAPSEMSSMSDELRVSGWFGPVTMRSYRWSLHYTIEQFLDLMSTHSDHRMLAERDRWTLLEGAAAVLERRGGGCEVAYETRLCLARALA